MNTLNLDNLGQLITHYIDTAQLDKALEIAEIMARIDPELAQELDQFKKELRGEDILEIE